MKKNNIVLVLMVGIFFSCASSKETSTEKKDNVFIYWVASSKKPCQGVTPMQCMLVKKGENLEWSYFYDVINGFNYEPGFLYKLKVKEEQIPLDQVPADASSIRYTLLEIVEKTADTTSKSYTRLHDIWVLEKLGLSETFKENNSKQAHIEINLTKNKFFGNDGCNNIMGGLKRVDAANLEFGIIAGTKMACPDMQNSYKFTQALGETKTYKIEGLKLFFFDMDGKVLLQFKKVD